MPLHMRYDPRTRTFTDTRDGTVVPESEAEGYVRRYAYKDGHDDERHAYRAAIEAKRKGGGDGGNNQVH